jgi:uncharacterized coiled-coil DUF342 family protein
MNYHVQIRDVNQKIMVYSCGMDETYQKVECLKNVAENEVSESKKRVKEARTKIREKGRHINEHIKEINQLQSNVSEQELVLQGKSEELAVAIQYAQQTKGNVLIGIVGV